MAGFEPATSASLYTDALPFSYYRVLITEDGVTNVASATAYCTHVKILISTLGSIESPIPNESLLAA